MNGIRSQEFLRCMALQFLAGAASGLMALYALDAVHTGVNALRAHYHPLLHISITADLSVACNLPPDLTDPLTDSCSLQIG